MNYNKIVQGILDIGESMLISGAENYRIEDSLYRMCRSYGFVKYDVFVIPSNIQITVETENGDIITQVRHIENADIDFDQLDYMNNLCRYICSHTPVSYTHLNQLLDYREPVVQEKYRTNTINFFRRSNLFYICLLYTSIRHRRGLPVRGQKTKTNARTRKGPKRTVANKKK